MLNQGKNFRNGVCIVVPTFNEVGNLPALFQRIAMVHVPQLSLLLVDDNSPDDTAKKALELRQGFGYRIDVIKRLGKYGLRTAYQEGFEYAIRQGNAIIIQMDADLSHGPEYIPTMVDFLERYDVVIGSRYKEGGCVDDSWGLFRRILSDYGNFCIRKILKLQVLDATSGFKAFRSHALKSIDWDLVNCKGFGFQAEIAFQCEKLGLSIYELPIEFTNRTKGKSKMSLGIVMEVILKIFSIRMSSQAYKK